MAIKFTVPTTSNCLELRIRVSRTSSEQLPPEVTVAGTPYVNAQVISTESNFYLTVFIAALTQTQSLASYTNGEITLDSSTGVVSALCLSAQQDLTSLSLASEETPITTISYTSKPYPALFDDAVNLSHTVILSGSDTAPLFGDPVDLSMVTILGGELLEALIQYDNWEPEAVNLSHVSITSGELDQILLQYDNWEPESVNLSQVLISSGTLDQVLIRYQNWAPESVDLSHVSITSGTLS